MVLEMIKIPIGELTNFPYLRAIAKTRLPVILSTGMANLHDIEKAILGNGIKEPSISEIKKNILPQRVYIYPESLNSDL